MQELGQRMRQHGVRDIFFVHGTFAGYDPLGIFLDGYDGGFYRQLVGQIASMLLPGGIAQLQGWIKQGIDARVGDMGNFLRSYVETCAERLDNDVCRTRVPFDWSGANLHGARLDATVRLAGTVARSIKSNAIHADERVLLIGHSHAGQLFALLTHFLQDTGPAGALMADVQREMRAAFVEDLNVIRGVWLDFVTYGTPVRYRWARYAKLRLLPIINHRSEARLDFRAIYDVADGDYIQQWGTEGTNLPSSSQIEQRLSAVLNDAGFDLAKILAMARKSLGGLPQPRMEHQYPDGERVAPNLLIDYRDQRPAGNRDPLYCGHVLLGHGAYTTFANMECSTRAIADMLYA
ncbi:MAG: hypothetical protein RLZZ227_339 [Pseudomonadota bacterium]